MEFLCSFLNSILLKKVFFNIVKYDKSFYNATYNNNQGPLLLINHYRIQSLEFWKKVKMTRGDAECWYDYLNKKRDIDEFNKLDINEVRDTTLKEQNKFIKN